MRLFTGVCCSLLLAAVCIAQTSPSPTDSGQQPGSEQQPGGQQPGLSTVPNPAQQSQQPPKPQASSFNLGESLNEGKDQELGELRLMARYTEVNGDASRSFLVPGVNDLGEFNYFLDRRFLETGRRMQTLVMYRGTNDSSIDPETNSLQKGFLRIYGQRDEYIIGDMMVNYSLLSFNQNIRGLSASWKLGKSWKLSAVGGVFIDRWGSTWKDITGRPYLSSVAGSRLEYRFRRDSALGFNFSYSKDNTGTLPLPCDPTVLGLGNCAIGVTPDPANNKVGSVDLKMQFPFGLRMASEFAYSFTDFDIRRPLQGADLPCLANPPATTLVPCDTRSPQFGIGPQSDWGGRVEANYRRKKLNLRAAFLRYQPNFASINARQISDLQEFQVRASYELTSWLTVNSTARRQNNNLRKQLTAQLNGFETVNWGPEVRFIVHDLGFYRRGVLEFGYRYRDIQGNGVLFDPSNPGTCIQLSPTATRCIDRVVRSPFVEVTAPYHRTFFSIGYERQHVADNLDHSQDDNIDRVYGTLRGMYDVGGWRINPVARYELVRESHRPNLTTCAPPLPITLSCLNPLAYDNNRLASVGIFAEAPRWFIIELAFRDTTSTIFGPAGYSRPSYRAAVTYKIRNDSNTELIFSFDRNNSFYLPIQVPSLDFDERVTGVTFVWRFGKRG